MWAEKVTEIADGDLTGAAVAVKDFEDEIHNPVDTAVGVDALDTDVEEVEVAEVDANDADDSDPDLEDVPEDVELSELKVPVLLLFTR